MAAGPWTARCRVSTYRSSIPCSCLVMAEHSHAGLTSAKVVATRRAEECPPAQIRVWQM
ncbi:hypothetical protein TBKG_01671 [Mycobacterium tuberculosis '98-R604 INH-RIF-EM']|uniref:Uncharacterized protein n=1 Tax=Mycobacterium tuberculosis (strain CDC 1551 / Oshkosh) TaxID=83331 RepID=Q8VK93_MYCTO|nr:hypothetical protein MT1054.1 [Mycobacterium tuberculosis CDC1551]EFD46407.1 conserved hypothetical protein [Mycobacterium tuberculosis T17]EPZ63982.1 hypothetical protein TBKG_01671 [Mycobacterium tuberculosis '98-R604 INH-RIF-EM']